MKNKYILIGFLSIAVTIFSCKKDVLDIKPTDQINDVLLWSNQNMVLTYTANFYSQLNSGFKNIYPNGPILTGQLLADFTDDATVNSTNLATFWNGAYTSNTSPVNTLWTSTSNGRWLFIRRANIFLAKIDAVPGDAALNQRMKGEIKFLRAYYYFDLMNWFGTVPIITTAQNEIDDSAFMKQNTKEECIDFLVKELTEAADLLPASYGAADFGRITKGAAQAMKCRAQLYAGRWKDAAATAKIIMDANTYSLISSYTDIFSKTNKTNKEVILSVQANANSAELSHSFDVYNQPPTFGGRGSTLPTQNLVDDYEMQATGLPITNAASGYNPQNPYAGRDPRFATSILYDGATFRGRVMEMFTGGIDVNPANSQVAGWLTNTGYYLRKFTDETLVLTDANVASSQNWVMFRYAEVLLNYAEAQNEAVGPDQSVYDAVNAVRKRSNMPVLATDLTQETMRTAIRHERKIELAFEDARYWDVKRWKLATNLFSSATNPIKGITITKNAVTGVKTYTPKTLTTVRIFQDKHYLFPYPLTEMTKPGNLMTQNTGW